jgi:P2 family phage contractile tail tube protein
MSAAAQMLKNFNLYVDGRGYAGNAEEVTLPNLNITGEDYRAAGMDAPVEVDLGMEKLELSFKVSKWETELEGLFGQLINATFRGAVEDLDGTVKACVIKMRGKIHAIERDSVTPGAKVGNSYRMPLVSYSYSLDGVTVHDIDVVNMKRIIGGVDRLAAQRRAIGL